MSIEHSLEEQQLLEDSFHRAGSRVTGREFLWSIVSGSGLLAAVVALFAIDPPHAFSIPAAVGCLLVLALASRVNFDTPLGCATPVQLAFVPLVFTIPAAAVPVAVAAAFIVGRAPEIVRRAIPPSRLLVQPSNAWFAVGPAAVIALAHVDPWRADPALLLAALVAQFAADFAVSTIAFAFTRHAALSLLPGAGWVYGIDAALTAPALLTAHSVHRNPVAMLALVPLLGLLAVFAHERRKRLESTIELSNAYRGTALVLGDVVEADDGYTGEHCKSVVGLALDVGGQLGLSAARMRNLEFAALLHDVGKIAIPKEIINKPGKLDPHEWEIIKTHTIEGQKMLDRVGGFMRDVGLIVRAHHERWDGGGYPDGLTGRKIPLEARIVACCDTWNAMRTDRPYRKALDHHVAAAELTAVSGSQLDPNVVGSLLEIVAAEEGRQAAAAATDRLTLGAAGAPPPRLAYDSAHQAC
jgi:putative nucleotidyltransferase with HDIG domain